MKAFHVILYSILKELKKFCGHEFSWTRLIISGAILSCNFDFVHFFNLLKHSPFHTAASGMGKTGITRD